MSPQELLDEIAELGAQVRRKEAELKALQDACNHSWSSAEHHEVKIIEREAFPNYPWPKQIDPGYWTRKCQYCLKVERTTRTRSKPVVQVPDFEPEKPLTDQERKRMEVERLGRNSGHVYDIVYDIDPDVLNDDGAMV